MIYLGPRRKNEGEVTLDRRLWDALPEELRREVIRSADQTQRAVGIGPERVVVRLMEPHHSRFVSLIQRTTSHAVPAT